MLIEIDTSYQNAISPTAVPSLTSPVFHTKPATTTIPFMSGLRPFGVSTSSVYRAATTSTNPILFDSEFGSSTTLTTKYIVGTDLTVTASPTTTPASTTSGTEDADIAPTFTSSAPGSSRSVISTARALSATGALVKTSSAASSGSSSPSPVTGSTLMATITALTLLSAICGSF